MALSWFGTLAKTRNLRNDHHTYRVMSYGRDEHFRRRYFGDRERTVLTPAIAIRSRLHPGVS